MLDFKEIVFRGLDLLPFLVGGLILFVLLRWCLNLTSKRRAGLAVSSLAFFEKKKSRLKYLPEIIFVLGVLILIVALLNPVIPLTKNKKNIIAKEIMIILDFSESMTHYWETGNSQGDYRAEEQRGDPTKLDVERKYVIQFIESRKNDRVGLIVYSFNPYVASPLTQDYQALISVIQLYEINKNVSGERAGWYSIIPGEIYTATGEALFLTKEYFDEYGKAEEKIIVLFTDGNTNEGRDPREALEEIQKVGGFKVLLLAVDLVHSYYEELVQAIEETMGNRGFSFKVDTEEDFRKAVDFLNKWTGKNKMTVDEYTVDESQALYFGFIALVLFILVLFLKHLHFFRDLL